MDLQALTHPYAPGAAPGPESYLLVWDAPNLDMGLGAILGGRPTAAHRPRFDAVGRWLISLSDERSATLGRTIEPEATVFTNVSTAGADAVRPWVEALRNVGFAVFAKPKSDEDSDVDADMLTHIDRRRAEGVLQGLVVASADGQNFQEPIGELVAAGVPVTVLGFHEHASWAVNSPDVEFVDLEDIPGVFQNPLPRVNLDHLPEEGAWLQPFRPLKSLTRGTRA
ncbi:NYN domain-containing protein [Corynebacterium sp. BCW_4722]|nr:NYN domain-containing protein [Corynebacterium sp. BCW_4722]